MRQQGVISSWKGEKGFGFIQPDDGSAEIFVHINEFRSRKREPVCGDVVTYKVSLDNQVRVQAKAVLYQDESGFLAVSSRRVIAIVSVILYIALLVGAVHRHHLPIYVPVVCFVLNFITYFAYSRDKRAAVEGGWRTPESTLHFLAILGGWPAALIAQSRLRHKSSKKNFRIFFCLTAFMNISAVIFFNLS